MQQYADIYSLPRHSTCFGCHSTHHQEYLKTVSATSGISHALFTSNILKSDFKMLLVNSWTFINIDMLD